MMNRDPVEVVFPLSGSAFSSTPSVSPPAAEEKPGLFSYHAGQVKVPGPWKRGRPKGSKTRNRTQRPNGAILDVKSRVAPQPPPFEFINLSPKTKDVDKSAQTRIRSHARRSREGKGPAKQRDEDRRQVLKQQWPEKLAEHEWDVIGQKVSILVDRYNLHQISGVDPFNALPLRLEPYMHDLLVFFCTNTWKSLYTLERAAGYNPFSEYWLPMGFTDSAVLHTFIGCADAFISYFVRLNGANRAAWHLCRAISIVNERLAEATATAVAKKNCISSGTLVLVAGIAMFERSNGRNDHWELHMQGLKQLVHYHGGLESLYSQPAILQKVFRADLYGALDDDLTPYFDGYDACIHLAEAFSPSISLGSIDAFHSAGFDHLSRTFPQLDPTLVRCARQLEEAVLRWSNAGGFEASQSEGMALTASTGGSAALQKTTPTIKRPTVVAAMQLRHLLTGIEYALVSDDLRQTLASAATARDRRLGEMVRIGLVMFSLSILNERPMNVTYGLKLVEKLRWALNEEAQATATGRGAETEIPIPIDLQLWAIFLAASATRGGRQWPDKTKKDDETSWLLDAFTSRLSTSEYDSRNNGNSISMGGAYHRVQARLCQYLWVPCIHDKLFRRMWSVATTSTGTRITELGTTY